MDKTNQKIKQLEIRCQKLEIRLTNLISVIESLKNRYNIISDIDLPEWISFPKGTTFELLRSYGMDAWGNPIEPNNLP